MKLRICVLLCAVFMLIAGGSLFEIGLKVLGMVCGGIGLFLLLTYPLIVDELEGQS